MIDLYQSLKCTLEQQICKLGCKETYYSCIGKNSAPLKEERITLLNMWTMFNGALTEAQVNTLWCYYEKHFGQLTQIVKTSSTNSGGSGPNPPPPPPPPTESFELEATNQQVYLPINSGSLKQAYFVDGNDPTYVEIMSPLLLDFADTLNCYAYVDSGEPANHYLVRYAADTIGSALPTVRGGFNCTQCCNDGTNCCDSYPVSFQSHAMLFCQTVGSKIIFNSNLNNFSIPAYTAQITYAQAQCGFAGIIVAQEYAELYCSCGLCGASNFAAIAAAGSTLTNGINSTLPHGSFVTMDWKGTKPGTSLTNAYSDGMETTAHITDFRIYASEPDLIPVAEYATGRTGAQYLTSINTGVDSWFPTVVNGIKTASGKPVSIPQYFTVKNSGFANTWLQMYFIARLRIKMMELEALTPGSINYACFARFFDICSTTIIGPGSGEGTITSLTVNNFGIILQWMAPMFTSGNMVYQVTLPSGIYGIASVNTTTNSGYLFVVNSNSTAYSKNSVTFGSVTKTITSINSMYSSTLLGTITKGSTTNVPAQGISIITF